MGGVVRTHYCTECACIDPDNLGEPPVEPCGSPNWKGDGRCDDQNNNAGCEYDGGDCCPLTVPNGEVKTNHCEQCECLDPDNQGEPTTSAPHTCGRPNFVVGPIATTRTTTQAASMMVATVVT